MSPGCVGKLPSKYVQPTTSFHDYVRSSANAPSPTPVQSLGILFQYTSEKRWTFIVLKNFSRLTLLVQHIMFISLATVAFYLFLSILP